MPSKRGKKACTECRQQKAKCDAFLNPGQPCSRCQKVKARCIISDPFKREHKRKRLSELEQETDELRRKLRTSEARSSISSPIAMLTAAAQMENVIGSGENQSALPSSQDSLGYSQPAITQPALFPPSMPLSVDSVSGSRGSDRTLPRTINGIKLTSDEIDDIFQLFFQDYAQWLPILDPKTSPNTYYSKSPFLFWSIIRAASRSYSKNPTLLNALSRSIMEMGFLSLISTSSAMYTIKGLLILLYWPFPRENDAIDPAFPLSGMLLHLAMQNGLHIPMSSHEFSRVRIAAPSEADLTKRSELWAQCVIVYQRTCLSKGQSPRSLSDLTPEPIQSHVLFQRISPSLALELRCQETIVRCCNAVLENGVRALSPDQERALDIILRMFDTQVKELELQSSSDTDRFHILICRLHIQSFHLFKTNLSDDFIARLVAISCTVLEKIGDIGNKPGLLAASPLHIVSAAGIAACLLLRILKTSVSGNMDIERAKSAIFLGINIMKQISAGGNETAGKFVLILNQLWNSSKAFRKSEGSEYSGLRIRSRLSMSVTIDAFWRWRDEFDTQHRTLLLSQESTEGQHNTHENSGATSHDNPAIPSESQEAFFLDDQFLSDFEWALGDNRLFPPTEPCGPIWSSTTSGL
ncbi:transcriptional regulator family: Fungal Specific TF [Paecilomyces variotii]|nr:transcriptional regulator family: Fungal Specific TF [Paecilomyces variotii]KAJ9281977.1 transcriptional regulator family: Fungal Specific TF [Paecilomyces variotii]KAJ9309739.1 transcriptional regulator family: Fungal Specific TF [Paecilomyces variotii]KAJ9341980.1 transcriptional regulator family: Fungal Specific TF [Paecilomyces variotii]KAJ9368892.1 transcriptional regulator family: Fungal Specific TF [Paecilomyces variotii]